jgi:predicted GH43/DUF377 family glycosyl hydrolase
MKFTLEKLGQVFKPSGNFYWNKSHAQVPFPMVIEPGSIRIFFATRDEHSRSSVSFIDVDADNPKSVVYVHEKPCFSFGPSGYFDDSGTMPSWFLKEENRIILYYTAWNKSESASYRLSIGIAESSDNGVTFVRKFDGPIMDRGPYDPIWVGQPCVLKEENIWKMWYLSCEKIEKILDHPEPFYNVKYATSPDGINWHRQNQVCVPFDENTDAVGRPFVFLRNQKYFMLHSNRRSLHYRNKREAGYRIELSESKDGIIWEKAKGFQFLKSREGWDNIMNEYASVFPASENSYWIFYNGNGFGATGFGLARMTIN